MLRKITLLLATIGLTAFGLYAQKSWTLQECIEYARQNNLSVKQAEYNIQDALLTEQLNQMARLPNLSGRATGVLQFGRTIDPTTNTFNNERILSNSFSVDAGMTLFNGNRINNNIKQSKINSEAARLDAQSMANDIGLSIANAYLNILLAEEQLQNARQRLSLSEQQLEQTDKLIKAGSLPPNDRLDFLAQIATNEQDIINAQNLVDIGYLNLKQLMELDPSEEMRIVQPATISIPEDADPRLFGLEEVYTSALQTQPQVRAADLRLESAQIDESLSRAGYLPTLTIFASLNTNYSSAFRDFTNPILDDAELVLQDRSRPVLIDGMEAIVQEFNLEGVEYPRKEYTDQLNETFGQTVGLSLSIPIYSNHRNKIAVERARLGFLNTQVTNRQMRQQLKTDVQRAIADARAAQKSLMAAEHSVDAAEAAFDNAEKRFNLGAINTLQYATARNTLDLAEVEYVRAKYQYIFNLKVVDFYLGRPINLE